MSDHDSRGKETPDRSNESRANYQPIVQTIDAYATRLLDAIEADETLSPTTRRQTKRHLREARSELDCAQRQLRDRWDDHADSCRDGPVTVGRSPNAIATIDDAPQGRSTAEHNQPGEGGVRTMSDPIESIDLTGTTDPIEAIVTELRRLRRENERLADRVTALEGEVTDLETEVETLEAETEQLETTIETLEARVQSHDTTLDAHDTQLQDHDTDLDRLDALTEATRNKAGTNKARLEELQARELEKGAHLHTALVDKHEIDVPDDRLERITKADDESYYRLPNQADPIGDDDVTLSYGDLLPIQQLARMDADMRRSAANALPTRLAAKLWQARTDPAVGDDPWEDGSKTVDAHLKASDLKHWIRRQEEGISDTYAKKLVSRTIDAILDLSNHRLAVRKRTERKNGLEYTERRLILPADADIPGTGTSGTGRRSTAATRTRPDGGDRSGDPTRSERHDRSDEPDRSTTAPHPETADVHG